MLGVMDVRYAWEYDDTDHARPAEIVRLEALCNTIDRHTYGAHADKSDDERDLLSTPQNLVEWLADVGLPIETTGRDRPGASVLSAVDVENVRSLRDGLRAWLQARQAMTYEPSAVRNAQQVLDRVTLHVDLRIDEPDTYECTLTTPGPGIFRALGTLAADLAIADARGTLQRLKICHASDCGFVFYDHSRSRTSRWCSMDTCGNRVKTRRYRQRHR